MREHKLQTIDLNHIRIQDNFWTKYTKLVTSQIIPYQWEALNDRVKDAESSHCISNFEIAAGLRKGRFEGWVFQDTDLAKWLEAVAYSLSYEKNEELERLADSAIDLIGKAQQEDGYLDTHFSILMPDKEFCNLKEGHELYTAGHMMEAAVAYYKVTGKEKFLKIMCKNADLICETFHTAHYENAVPGHEEVELALVKLAEVTGEQKYMDMAKDFIDRRGCEPNYLVHEHEQPDYVDIFHDPNPFLPEYSQCHRPVREQKTAEGHAVRAVYLYAAMADLAYAYHDETLMQACEKLYENITEKRMYITGGIGSSGAYERFTTDYDLSNDSNYSESCASIGLAFFCRRMAMITGDAKYIDTMEVALMNTVLAGIAMDGKSFFYVNPLEVWPANCLDHSSMAHVKPVRQKWFGCACCPPNIARTLASLGEYVCFTGEDELWLNLFASGEIHTTLSGTKMDLTVSGQFPYRGEIELALQAAEEVEGKLYIRVPGYAKNPRFVIDGKEVAVPQENGYAVLEARWKHQVISYSFDMPAHFVYANPQVRADAGKTAIVKGPIVYCLEQDDNGANLSNLFVDTTKPLEEVYDEELLGGIVRITAHGKRMRAKDWTSKELYYSVPVELDDTELTLIPYCCWGNRNPGEMAVWMKILHSN